MVCMMEFELVPEEGGYAVVPFGAEGATQGDTEEEAVEMAADWLRTRALCELEQGREPKSGPLGNEPSRGGRVVAVAVDASISDIPAVTAAEAARMLGVSTARVAQLCRAGELMSWRVGRARMVSRASVECRAAACPAAGRPRSELAAV